MEPFENYVTGVSKPEASFSLSNPSYPDYLWPVIDEEIVFDASSSMPSEGASTIVGYLWEFDDGTGPVGTTSPIYTHTYSADLLAEGSSERHFTVTLTVMDDQGRTDSTSFELIVKRPPVLLVHGFQLWPWGFDLDETWRTMAIDLTGKDVSRVEDYDWVYDEGLPFDPDFAMKRVEGNGFVVFISCYTHETSTATMLDIQWYAKSLANEIQLIKKHEHVTKVDIVGHSMGGIVSRTYIENEDLVSNPNQVQYRGDVRKLVFLGTPNQGTSLAAWLTWASSLGIDISYYECAQQLAEGSIFMSQLNSGATGEEKRVEYSGIAGNRFDAGPFLAEPNDLLVAVREVWLDEIPASRRFVFDLTHTQLRIHTGPVISNILTSPSFGGEPIPIPDFYLADLCSPGELRVYDSQERITGLVNGQVIEEIPNSVYDEEEQDVIILPVMDSYYCEVMGMEEGSYGLRITSLEGGQSVIFVATDIPTTSGAVHQYTIDWDALSEGEEGVTIEIDSDGDGEFEDTLTSDGELTQDEFILQTATVIDFDPDTLNLKSKEKFVTVYIELPPGYDASQIDISSIKLNGTVPVLTRPTRVDDYDKDSVPDLMVKFDGLAVEDILTVGEEVEVTITGEVAGITFEGGDNIRVIAPAAAHGHGEWTRVSTPTTEGWVLAPDSVIVDYAVADDGEVAYAIVYSYDTDGFHLLKSTDGAATWDDITDGLEDVLDDNDYINYLPRVATDNIASDFVAVVLDMWDDSDGADEVHVFISTDSGSTLIDTGEVEDGGVYFPDGFYVSDLAVSPEDDGMRDIATGGYHNYGNAALFRCTVTGDSPSAWEDATTYDGWDDDTDFDSYLVTDIIFSPSWAADKTILVTTVADYGPYDVYLQSGFWGTSEGWNEMSTLGIEAVPIMEDVDIPIWLADFDARRITGITVPSDYNSRNSDTRVLWVWVNYYDPSWGEPACEIMRVDDDSANLVGPMGQIEDEELWLTNISYKGTIAEGEAIAGVLGDGIGGLAECCYGVQVYRNDGVQNMDICCERWHDACKPPTGTFAMAVSYVGEDKAYAVSLWGFFSPYDEDAWSVSFDDGDFWNQLSLIDTHIDYLSDVAVSPDCNKTMLVSVNEETGCGCDSAWLHAENLPEAPEYSGKWLRTWCGQLEGDLWGGWERGLLRLAPGETTGDNVYLVDYGSGNVYWNNLETLACWDPIGCTELDFIVDLAAQDADSVYALDYYGDVAMFDENEWQEGVDSKVEYGWTIAVQGDDILVGGCDGDVSYSDDGGETFTELEQVPVAAADYTLVTVAFDSYFDANNTIYAALAGFEGSSPTTGGIYRWVIGESDEWEDLGADDYAYTSLVLNVLSGGKPKTSADTGGALYASYVNGDTTGVARCLTPAEDVCCSGTDWDYLTRGLTSELFKMTPQALKICGCLTGGTNSMLFAIDSSDYYDLVEGLTGTVWSFED